MEIFYKWSVRFIIFLQGIILFLLVFEDQVQIPFTWMGRLHPLILHLPIGFGVLLALLFVLREAIQSDAFQSIFRLVLHLTTLFTAFTALLGFFLSQEGGYDTSLLTFHQWSGIGVNLFFVGALWWSEKKQFSIRPAFYISLCGLLAFVVAGHGGGNLTHGEGYLFASQVDELVLTQESVLFDAAIKPIFKQKCEVCHNDQKTKGQLNMSTVAKLIKGGKNGPIWKAGDVVNSHIIQRSTLPLDDKKHMPPKGKAQLSQDEILLLEDWVKTGASLNKKLGEYGAQSNIVKLVTKINASSSFVKASFATKKYPFSAASAKDIEAVNTPFCTVYPLASDASALLVDFYVNKKFERKALENLTKVSEQIVGINLAKMPFKDVDIVLLTKFPNVEMLNLNFTEINGSGLEQLVACQNLKSLSISGNSIPYENIRSTVAKMPSLKQVFIWNTTLKVDQIANLKKQFPRIVWEQGYIPKDEKIQINPPILVTENFILRPQEDLLFKHTLKGVDIHYTLNDSLPDSLGTIVTRGPIQVQNYKKVKVIATKAGWLASRVVELKVYKSKFLPDSVYLLTEPEPEFKAQGGSTLKDFKLGGRDMKGATNRYLGYMKNDFVALAEFKKPQRINGITLSYLRKTDSGIFPPTKIEIYAGNDPKFLRLIETVIPGKPTERNGFTAMGLNIPIKPSDYRYFKFKANVLRRLPNYLMRDGKKEPVVNKGKPGRMGVDELLFY